jgi:hypothetical protein
VYGAIPSVDASIQGSKIQSADSPTPIAIVVFIAISERWLINIEHRGFPKLLKNLQKWAMGAVNQAVADGILADLEQGRAAVTSAM